MKFINAEDYNVADASWLVEDMFLESSHVLLYGQTGHCKSFVAIDLACSVASGQAFFGRGTHQGDVLYVAAEAPHEIVRRINAWREDRAIGRIPVYVYDDAIQIPNEDQVEDLLESIKVQGIAPKLIIFDTFGRCALGVEENVADQINAKVNAPLTHISRATGATVVLIHHTGTASNRPRGSTALSDPCDTVVRVSKSDKGVSIYCDKQRSNDAFTSILATPRAVGGTQVLDYIGVGESLRQNKVTRLPRRKEPTNPERIEHIVSQHPDGIRKADAMTRLGMSRSSFYHALPHAEVSDQNGLLISLSNCPVQSPPK